MLKADHIFRENAAIHGQQTNPFRIVACQFENTIRILENFVVWSAIADLATGAVIVKRLGLLDV